MLVEVWVIHPQNRAKYAEIEHHNANHFEVHPLYYKRMMDLDLSKYVVSERQQVAYEGWWAKTVQELVCLESEEPSFYMRARDVAKLRQNRVLAVI